eukprot:TRINITY_DN6277_c0_g1_i1.p1 TRINITY_DN6277_c0_g1~~TRINITY_DN6277_c0_g1_i1.p1  ORF type:complete len:148 (-),score=27.78 TRINITY_DN6277_c0_g1_i1:871-1269(-)
MWRVCISHILVSLFLWFCLTLPCSASKECRVVSGKEGLCVPIKSCKVLVQLINNLQKPLPGDVGMLLKESFFCGQEAGQILTCCPLEGIDDKKSKLRRGVGLGLGSAPSSMASQQPVLHMMTAFHSHSCSTI